MEDLLEDEDEDYDKDDKVIIPVVRGRPLMGDTVAHTGSPNRHRQ